VNAAKGGDRAALDALLRRHYDRIYAVCRRMTGDDSDAADAAQEALIAVVRGLPRFDGRAAFSTWAYRIAANACIDELRRRKRRPDPGLPEIEHAPRGHPPLTDQSVSDRLDLDAALARLPHDFRLAVVLRDQLGLEYAEIATVLEIPVGTVRSRLSRGRAALADQLGDSRRGPNAQTGLRDPNAETGRNRRGTPNVEETAP
jgi:RNA polymerase sigma-70 factor (ECF subfamily)